MSDVRIRVSAGNVRLEYEGSQRFFDRLIAPLVAAAYRKAGMVGGEESGQDVTGPVHAEVPRGPIFQPSSPQHFRQFAGQVGARAATVDQRIMAFGFYLWNFERQDEIGGGDIRSFFHTVHEDPPQDLDERLTALSEQKRFLEVGTTANSWRLTTKGVNYVKNRLLGPA